MNEKMYRFLKSLGYEDPEYFDMDFLLVKMDRPTNTVNMKISKDTPWEVEDWERFTEAVLSVGYETQIEFVYTEDPSFDNVHEHFDSWISSSYHPITYELSDNGDGMIELIPSEPNDDSKRVLEGFQQYLNSLSYPYRLVIGEKIDESMVSNENESQSEEMIDEYEENKAAFQREFLKELKEKNTFEERQRAVHTKGNYVPVDDLSLLYKSDYKNVEIEGELFGIAEKNAIRKNRAGKSSLSCGIGEIGKGRAVFLRIAESESIPYETILKISQSSGKRLHVKGAMNNDMMTGQLQVYCHYVELVPDLPLRTDEEERKRVELHLHTKMSQMDGLSSASEYIDTAINMGMKGIAITDHGVLQAYPEAESHLASLKKKNPDLDFKLLYGIEFYAFHKPKFVYNPKPIALRKGRYIVLDFETTGLSSTYDRPTEFGAVLVENGMIVNSFQTFINAGMHIPEAIQEKTKITDEIIKDAPKEHEALMAILDFIGPDENTILVAHNSPFDIGILNAMLERDGKEPIKNPVIDTLAISHWLRPYATRHNLGALSKDLQLDVYDDDKAHRADFDASALNSVWHTLIPRICDTLGNGDCTLEDLDKANTFEKGMYRSLKCSHITAIAKNQAGLKDLFKLVSKSETTYMNKDSTPRIDFEDIASMRENLLLGSACQNGEIFVDAIEKSDKELYRDIPFYDYIEIQPKGNYSNLVDTKETTEERLDDAINRIIRISEELGKKVVATSDCHYLNKEEKILRDIYINQKAIGGGFHPLASIGKRRLEDKGILVNSPDQHFLSTKEMLDEFRKFVSEEKAREYVIDNTNWVLDQIDPNMKVLKDRLYKPDANLPGSDVKLREICYNTLHERYGDNPDPLVKERLEKELAGIIGNGYSVTYYIAHLLNKWAASHNFFVGSRGSVGSSFAATMAGISEVNPLNPHYLCPKCHHFEWAEDSKCRSGFDLPEKKCPECGHKMTHDGQSIPFETFLGFHAEKVPDIDLNFPQDHLDEAHDETRRLLSTEEENKLYAAGKEVQSPHVIRAGTIGTVEKKTAFGYVKGYYQHLYLINEIKEKGIVSKERREEISKLPFPDDEKAYGAYLAEKCTGVQRSTGQHPGGIVVIPADMDIFDFAPYQYPSGDPSKGVYTTHFDFGSMHDSILKLDELGHIDPMALRMMHEATGKNFREIPMNDEKVLSLFTSPKALNMKANPLSFKTGAIGLPEFGTSFVQGLLEEAKPKTFNDLLIISGLSHGTNVWSENAEDLIVKKGKRLEDVIGCRDDIMNYLIGEGIDSSLAFSFMEVVRKNKDLCNAAKIETFIPKLAEGGIPDWYLDSCRKIQYLFPRAHATAYVMAAVRVAWYKVYEPLAFYAVYFSTRCDKFDIATMSSPLETVLSKVADMQARSARGLLDDVEKEVYKGLLVAVELLERGYKIKNVDIMKSDAQFWKVDKDSNSIIPPFTVIPNFSISAAKGIMEARKEGAFLSKEDLLERVKAAKDENGQAFQAGSSVIEALEKVGALDGLDDTNQMNLFDFSF